MFDRIKDYLLKFRRRNKLIAYFLMRLFKSPPRFTLQGRSYTQFWHRYNTTWRNERAVEVPVVWGFLQDAPGARVLEVGNVLSHYFPVAHDVVDKYERGPGVINADVCTFRPPHKYDLIVSISTLEHVGWDEDPRQPENVLQAFQNLTSLLAPGGRAVVTLPVGYNRALDGWISEGKIAFTQRFYLQRVSPANQWNEVTSEQACATAYDSSVPTATALLIGIIAPT